jgi:hypothetical protein
MSKSRGHFSSFLSDFAVAFDAADYFLETLSLLSLCDHTLACFSFYLVDLSLSFAFADPFTPAKSLNGNAPELGQCTFLSGLGQPKICLLP